jgi:hypothetical protein
MFRVLSLLTILLLPPLLAACQNPSGQAPCNPPSVRDQTGECVTPAPRR